MNTSGALKGELFDEPVMKYDDFRSRMSNGGWIVLLIYLLLFLPFVGKAFHIDDYSFISYAEMINWDFITVTPRDFDLAGNVLQNLIPYEMTHPPLVPYIIKIITALFGKNEVALHLCFLIFPLISIFSILKLRAILFPCQRTSEITFGVFFCTLPAFVVNAQNVMTDVPSLAFLLLGIAFFLDGLESGSRLMTSYGSAALTLAVFSSYQMSAFILLLLLYARFRGKITLQTSAAIFIPLLILLVWLFLVYNMYGVFPLLKSSLTVPEVSIRDLVMEGLVTKNIFKKIFTNFAFIGAGMIWIIPLQYALNRDLCRFWLIYSPLVIVSYMVGINLVDYSFSRTLLLSALVSLGVLTVIKLVSIVWQRKSEDENVGRDTFLLLWVLCVFGYCNFLFPFGAARYLLPAFPPILMILFSDQIWQKIGRVKSLRVNVMLCCAVLFALMSAFSDYKYAGCYRDFTEFSKVLFAAESKTSTVWYIGEWGMHYYMEKAGARYLYANSNEPLPGDYIIIPEMTNLWLPSQQLKIRWAYAFRSSYSSWLPLRLFNMRSNAGFYSDNIGLLPFAFSFEPDEVFTVFKIVR